MLSLADREAGKRWRTPAQAAEGSDRPLGCTHRGQDHLGNISAPDLELRTRTLVAVFAPQ